MKLIRLFILLIILFAESCHHKDGVRYFSKGNNKLKVKFNSANIKEAYKGNIVHIMDSLIILTNTFNDGKQIHIYNQDFKLINSSGIKGLGPGELVNPFTVTLDCNNKIIWFCDMARKRILKYPIDSIFLNDDYRPSDFVPIPKEVSIILLYNVYSDSIFSFINLQQNKDIISFFNMRGEIVDSLSIKDNLKLYKSAKLIGNPKSTFYYCSHPIKEAHAIAYMFSDVLSIVDYNGEILSVYQGPDNINQQPQEVDSYKTLYTYRGMECDSNFIYCLYLGDVVAEKGKETANSPYRIHIFDWYGNPVAALIFDKPISSFVIDHFHNRIIGWSPDSCDLLYCDLPMKYLLEKKERINH